jgi:hypothetical protein
VVAGHVEVEMNPGGRQERACPEKSNRGLYR